MRLQNNPSFIDESYRINLIKEAKDRVCWISSYFSKNERQAIGNIERSLGSDKVHVYESQSKSINDEGYCFSLDEKNKYISVKLLPKNNEEFNESLLIVDNLACVYNKEPNKKNVNVRYLQGIDKVEFSELINKIENGRTTTVNIFGSLQTGDNMGSSSATPEKDTEIIKDGELSVTGSVNIRTDIILEKIQASIKKIDIKASGTRTNIRNVEINDILDIIGKPVSEIDERLIVRWKVFGEDSAIENEYKRFRRELELIKDNYIINLNSMGRYILVRKLKEFEKEIESFRIKLKNDSINIVERKIIESKSIIEKLIKAIYGYAMNDCETLKPCNLLELQNIIEKVQSKFPNADEVIEDSDIVLSLTDLSKDDITNKELCTKLLSYLDDRDAELHESLIKIMNSCM